MRCLELVLIAALIWSVECSNILMVLPMPTYSHFSLGFRIAKELADRNHQVTVINPYPQKTPIKNYRDIPVVENIAFLEEVKKKMFDMSSMNPINSVHLWTAMGVAMTEKTFQNKNVQDLLKSGHNFDLVIMEHFLNDAHIGLGHYFKAPVILLAPSSSSAINNYIFANPAPSSYVPNIWGTLTKRMNFWQRTQNLFVNILSEVVRQIFYLPGQREVFNKYIKTDIELDDVLYNVSLILTNSHVSVTDAVPHVPNVIEIGGFHVAPPKKLPEDLQNFLDESKEGVVLFSMGSNLKSKDLKPDVRNSLLRAFSRIKQKVLWKFEDELPDVPKNLKIMKWLPQQDVLAHPNVKAFINHGGLLSTIEAVYFGVPIIGIPVFGDQKHNVATAAENGYGINIPFLEISEDKVYLALNDILNDPKYRENVKQRSRVMNDQPLKPIDTAIYWIEHVIRHKGAPFFRTAGIDLKWYERSMIDIIIFLTLVTIVLFIIFYIIIKRILGLCFKKKQVKVMRTKKSN